MICKGSVQERRLRFLKSRIKAKKTANSFIVVKMDIRMIRRAVYLIFLMFHGKINTYKSIIVNYGMKWFPVRTSTKPGQSLASAAATRAIFLFAQM